MSHHVEDEKPHIEKVLSGWQHRLGRPPKRSGGQFRTLIFDSTKQETKRKPPKPRGPNKILTETASRVFRTWKSMDDEFTSDVMQHRDIVNCGDVCKIAFQRFPIPMFLVNEKCFL
jgi:hypothetical protein